MAWPDATGRARGRRDGGRGSRGVPHPWPMLLGIDHLVIAVRGPGRASAELGGERSGWRPAAVAAMTRLGTFNRLVWLGDSYLELIGVFDRASAASSWIGAPTLRALEAGGGLATWAIASDDLAADVAGLRDRGSSLAEPIDGERVRPDGRVVRWRLSAAEPLDRDRPPFLIEHDPAAAEWSPADRAERAARPTRLDVLELSVEDRRSDEPVVPARPVGLRFRPSLSGGGARDADIGVQRDPAPPGARPRAAADNGSDLRTPTGAVSRRRRPRPPLDPAARGGDGAARCTSRAPLRDPRPGHLTSGTRRTASPGSARGAPPRCPSSGRAACRAGR